jgi:hypothetical protein
MFLRQLHRLIYIKLRISLHIFRIDLIQLISIFVSDLSFINYNVRMNS